MEKTNRKTNNNLDTLNHEKSSPITSVTLIEMKQWPSRYADASARSCSSKSMAWKNTSDAMWQGSSHLVCFRYAMEKTWQPVIYKRRNGRWNIMLWFQDAAEICSAQCGWVRLIHHPSSLSHVFSESKVQLSGKGVGNKRTCSIFTHRKWFAHIIYYT